MKKQDVVFISNRSKITVSLFYLIITSVKRMRKVFINLDQKFFRYWSSKLKKSDVEIYCVTKESKGYLEKEPFLLIATLFKQAIDIKVVLGEMGHNFMERPEIIESLEYALASNNAELTMVHGPRVDPETSTIYDYEKEYNVNLHRLYNYKEHHFVIVKTKDLNTYAIDESTHNETYWGIDETDQIIPLETTKTKFYYLIPPGHHRIRQLEATFERRLLDSIKIKGRPTPFTRQDYSPVELIGDLIKNFLNRYSFQPISTRYDLPLDIPIFSVLPSILRNNKSHSMNVERDPNYFYKLSEILSHDYINLVSSLFYLEKNTNDTKGFINFIENELCQEPELITEVLVGIGLIIKEGEEIVLTNQGKEISRELRPNFIQET